MPARRPQRTVAAVRGKPKTPTTPADQQSESDSDSDVPELKTRTKKNGPRNRTGCLTCRLRHKNCPDRVTPVEEGSPQDVGCVACERMGVECLGWAQKRPKWLKVKGVAKKVTDLIRLYGDDRNINKGPLSFAHFYTAPQAAESWKPPFPVDHKYSLSLLSRSDELLHANIVLSKPAIVVTPVGENLLSSLHEFPSAEIPSPRDRTTKPPTLQIDTNNLPNVRESSPSGSESTSGSRVSSLPPLDPSPNSEVEGQLSPAPLVSPQEFTAQTAQIEPAKTNVDALVYDSFYDFAATADWAQGSIVQFDQVSNSLEAAFSSSAPFMGEDYVFATAESARSHAELSPDPVATVEPFSFSTSTLVSVIGVNDYVCAPRERSTVFLPHPLQNIAQLDPVLETLPQLRPPLRSHPFAILSPTPKLPSPAVAANQLHSVLTQWNEATRPFMCRFMRGINQVDTNALMQAFFTPGVEHDSSGMPRNGCVEAILVMKNLARLHTMITSQTTVDQLQILEIEQQRIIRDLMTRTQSRPGDIGNVFAALLGLGFYQILGGGFSEVWQSCIIIASTWVRVRWDDIRRYDRNVHENAKIFVGLTVWYDILGAVCLRQKPLLATKLEDILRDTSVVQLDQIMGCDNKTMLGIANIAAMAYWKQTEFKGTKDHDIGLKNRALQIIVHHLSLSQNLPTSGLFSYPFPSDMTPTTFSSPMSTSYPFPTSAPSSPHTFMEDGLTPRTITAAFRAAAYVYLYSTVSGCDPEDLDVGAAVDRAMEVLRQIPVTSADRSLLWPLCVIGAMARPSLALSSYGEIQNPFFSADQCVYFAARFGHMHEGLPQSVGLSVEALMKDVWRKRNVAPPGMLVDWIDAMSGQPLLVA